MGSEEMEEDVMVTNNIKQNSIILINRLKINLLL